MKIEITRVQRAVLERVTGLLERSRALDEAGFGAMADFARDTALETLLMALEADEAVIEFPVKCRAA